MNAVQDLNDTWAVFGRANGALEFTSRIKASYALGVAMTHPLHRSPTDQIGVAFGYSDVAAAPTIPANARNEKILEAFWNWALFGGLLVTPDVQLIVDPALNPDRGSVWVVAAWDADVLGKLVS